MNARALSTCMFIHPKSFFVAHISLPSLSDQSYTTGSPCVPTSSSIQLNSINKFTRPDSRRTHTHAFHGRDAMRVQRRHRAPL